MSRTQIADKLATLSTVLLSNLDEGVFYAQLSGYMNELFGEYKAQAFSVNSKGETILRGVNGKVVTDPTPLKKGEGLSGYVARLKRAYYSNSERDPLLSFSRQDESVLRELCAPIIVDGEILGTINIQSSKSERVFDESDTALILETLKSLEAALSNMKMYLMAKNLNVELQEQIKLKEKELSNRAPMQSRDDSSEPIEIIGHSPEIANIIAMATKVAKEDFPVLIQGDSGTGKKMLAKKIHQMSHRAQSNCIVVHCEAIESTRLESELFGRSDAKGLLEKADNGTLILESVHALPLKIQSKLLRTILSGEIFNIDSNVPKKINVRIISIANNNMADLIDMGEFREDLFYRLNIISMTMPSLKRRQGDIKTLAEYFLNKGKQTEDFKMLTANAISKLNAYSWPGNLQEMRNLMERTYILTDSKYIDVDDLPELKPEQEEIIEEVKEFKEMTLQSMEQDHICETLEHLGGNKTKAAKSLGITVKTLYNKLHSYGLVQPKSE